MRREKEANAPLWATEDEKKEYGEHVHKIQCMFRKRGVGKTPLLDMRIGDVVALELLVRYLEKALGPASEACEDREKQVRTQLLFVDAIGKASEKRRKAMSELELYLGKTSAPSEIGLPDLMKPIMKKAEGVFEEALARGDGDAPDQEAGSDE